MAEQSSPQGASRPDDALYQVVAARRLGHDTLLWQVPVMSLTAQAFLLTIALGASSSVAARVVSSLLSLVSLLASMQLMARHRPMELMDARWLEACEKTRYGFALHTKPCDHTTCRSLFRLSNRAYVLAGPLCACWTRS